MQRRRSTHVVATTIVATLSALSAFFWYGAGTASASAPAREAGTVIGQTATSVPSNQHDHDGYQQRNESGGPNHATSGPLAAALSGAPSPAVLRGSARHAEARVAPPMRSGSHAAGRSPPA